MIQAFQCIPNIPHRPGERSTFTVDTQDKAFNLGARYVTIIILVKDTERSYSIFVGSKGRVEVGRDKKSSRDVGRFETVID